MSASVDQCLKAQASSVLHGPKAMKDEDAWRTQAQAYNPTSSNLADPYISSYYASVSFPYLNQGLGDGGATWSNDLTFLSGGYGSGDQASHYMDFGQSAFGSYAHFFPAAAAAGNGAGDYSAWGGNSAAAAALGAPRKALSHAPYHQDYYRESYDSLDHRGAATLKHIEQGMGTLTLGEFAKDGYLKPELVQKYADVSGGSKSWATVASQPPPPPAPKPKLVKSTCKTTMDIGTWENNKNSKAGSSTNGNNNNVDSNIIANTSPSSGKMSSPNQQRSGGGSSWSAPRSSRSYTSSSTSNNGQQQDSENNFPSHPVLDKLRVENEYNPKEFDLNPKGAKFFIIKSYSEDDIHRSIKYSIWCSTEHGNKRLDAAFKENKGPVYLLFSVNGSGHFCGMAQMMSPLDYNASSGVWAQDKWKGQFQVKWIYVKDVPNPQLRHIRLENNENKPVTNSRDTQEVPYEKGKQVLKIFHTFKHTTSIFDDFLHYEKRQEEDEQRKVPRRKD